MTPAYLRRLSAADVAVQRRAPCDPDALATAARIVEGVRVGGTDALRGYCEELGDLEPGRPLFLDSEVLQLALRELDPAARGVLERTQARIRAFAESQLECLTALDVSIEGGRAGHTLAAVERVGCYAPGGRFPLPSSVLMTAVPARVAGTAEIWIASPRPSQVTLAAAALAGADGFLAAGGAQAIAALAYGTESSPAVDLVCGPGNRYVTAAKQLVFGAVGIDLLAGPSELVVLADETASPALIAADLLAQAEHDVEARPILVTMSTGLAQEVDAELEAQLADLPTADTARAALERGFTVVCGTRDEAFATCDRLAPEHLEVLTRDPADDGARLRHYGALFLGTGSAEVFGDYGAGPNHVLPTGRAARFQGGLSVLSFLRVRTWMHVREAAPPLVEDSAQLARLEGLEAHARASEKRLEAPG